MRIEYTRDSLTVSDLDPDPILQLAQWLDDATSAGEIEPSAMCLATSLDGRPSCRMVLLRDLNRWGLVFYTNYLSRKGLELEVNPHASVCFWWRGLERQVRVEGTVYRVDEEESDAYFASRPRESQVSSIVSPQSQVIANREDLELAASQITDTSRPEHWGGYRLKPDAFEFWQGRAARLHDRFRYSGGPAWVIERLAP
ncbi:MAG: pyridoxamine 5'-phosphate oxidase [Chthonomonas sp.]|nr:pyridoxamine 5'-phosphate oxidase [Chthonomonas sp.]